MITNSTTDKNDEQHNAKVERLSFYRAEIKHEFSLLSSRVNAYIASQSFLTIAFALAMNNTNTDWGDVFTLIFPLGLSLLGVVTSVRSHEAIVAAVETIEMWYMKQNALFANDPAMNPYRLQRPPRATDHDSPVDVIQWQSLSFARVVSHVFVVAWCVFGTLVIFLHVAY